MHWDYGWGMGFGFGWIAMIILWAQKEFDRIKGNLQKEYANRREVNHEH